MTEDYRDPLAAAVSRLEMLERENAELKNAQSGRPATAAELEAVRHESELSRLEREWEAMRRDPELVFLTLNDREIRRVQMLGRILALIFLAFGLLLGWVGSKESPIIGAFVFTFLSGTGAVLYLLLQRNNRRLIRNRAARLPERERLAREIARLRGQVGVAEPPPSPLVRVVELDESTASDAEALSLPAAKKQG